MHRLPTSRRTTPLLDQAGGGVWLVVAAAALAAVLALVLRAVVTAP